jgi:hypothetical protein
MADEKQNKTDDLSSFRYAEVERVEDTATVLPLDPWKANLSFQEDAANRQIVVTPSSLRIRRDINLNSSKGSGGSIFFRTITFASLDATPSVKNATLCQTTGTTAITDFDDGVVGQMLMIKATGNITITNGTPIKLAGAANYAMTADDTLTLMMFDDQVWHEIARSVN